MRPALLALLLLAPSCAGTCSAIGGGSIGSGSIGAGAIGCGAIGGCAPVVGGDTPTPPGDPSLWFSAANIDGSNNATLASGDPVCTWTDLGSLGVDATQGTSSACPTYQAAGGPGGGARVVFDGAGDYLATADVGAALMQPNLAAIVLSPSNAASNQIVVDMPSGTFNRLGQNTSGLYANAGTLLQGAAATGGGWNTLLGTFSGASSKVRVNGTEATGNAGAQPVDGAVTIGAVNGGGGFRFAGSVNTMTVYDAPPAEADLEAFFEDDCACTFPVAP